jgi:CO/xanthine dehydrogenase Mo-binding subunit/aerobic-type carbon monoxide dehydrogenase small subunit (CoxS/CutS family)
MQDAIDIKFTVNNQNIGDTVNGEMTLLDYLRQQLGLTGAKKGCGQAQCGTCTVLLNGRSVKACSLKLKNEKLQGAVIETIEGLAESDGTLHPIQEAFIRAGALQCGFCTPGMIMTAKGLLSENPSPNRSEIRNHIAGRNLCRCTGYQKIIDAVEEAARVLRGGKSRLSDSPDDAPLRRQDAVVKVTGRLQYADDIVMDNMVYGKILFAAEPHARLKRIDVSAAQAMSGVIGVITAKDVPGSRKIGMIERDQPALVDVGDEIRSIADPIAAVFAESSAQARAALKAMEVSYEVLRGVFSIADATVPGAPQVYADKPGNIFYQGCLQRGEIDQALKESQLVVSGQFSTSRVAHGYLEPESGLARPDGLGGVEIYYPSQTVFDDQTQVAEVLNLPRNRVRVVQLPTGGAFGGKEDVVFHHILALAALKFDRPVKITLTRRESLRISQKKHATLFNARLGLEETGRFKALDVQVVLDKGAYATLGYDIIENVMAFTGGPYFIPAFRIDGRSIYTHNVMAGAMRGFGANQANYVIESLVDMAARKINMDPIEIRLKNALRPGLPTITDHVLEPGIPGVIETLQAAREALNQEQPPTPAPGTRLGIGLACGVKNIGFGHGLPESAGAAVELTADGNCHLMVTHHEYGQGAAIGQAKIAAETLGISIDRITVSNPDTAVTPFTGASTASRQTFISGNATLGACRRLLSDLFEKAAVKLGILDPASLALDGDAIIDKGSQQRLPLSELGQTFKAEFRTFPPETIGFQASGRPSKYGQPDFESRRTHWAYAYGVQVAWVQVDETTGAARVLKVITVGDVGRVLNRRAVEGQQEGGVVMGVGYALSEAFQVDRGYNLTKSLRQCGLPTAADAPEIVTRSVEVPHPWGPLGAKGLAEAPSLATAPAIANAICDAVGVRMRDLPMTPQRIKTALAKQTKKEH